MINFKDERLTGAPKYQITHEDETTEEVDIEMITPVAQQGTPLNKALFDGIDNDITTTKTYAYNEQWHKIHEHKFTEATTDYSATITLRAGHLYKFLCINPFKKPVGVYDDGTESFQINGKTICSASTYFTSISFELYEGDNFQSYLGFDLQKLYISASQGIYRGTENITSHTHTINYHANYTGSQSGNSYPAIAVGSVILVYEIG